MIGQRINNYEIVEQIGEGGMGTVYLAHHPFIGRKAAIKVLRADLARNADVVNRFLNEARAANAIGHPNIIDIIDAGKLPDGTPYLMMELLVGVSLARRIKTSGHLPVVQAMAFGAQIASALAAAHAAGIVHRDLKPENVFLVADRTLPGRETIKVLDFGIAKLHAELGERVQTQTGAVMGTPPYMSPEQCRGASTDVDHRTDIYSLGIILYEMLCGVPPFAGRGYAEILVMHLIEKPEPPSQRNPEVPPRVEEAILRTLAKSPADRHQSMNELGAALAALAAAPGHPGERAAPPPPVTRAPAVMGTRTEPAGAPVGETLLLDTKAPPRSDAAQAEGAPRQTTTFSSNVGQVRDLGTLTPARTTRRTAVVLGGVAVLAGLSAIGLKLAGGDRRSDATGDPEAPGSAGLPGGSTTSGTTTTRTGSSDATPGSHTQGGTVTSPAGPAGGPSANPSRDAGAASTHAGDPADSKPADGKPADQSGAGGRIRKKRPGYRPPEF